MNRWVESKFVSWSRVKARSYCSLVSRNEVTNVLKRMFSTHSTRSNMRGNFDWLVVEVLYIKINVIHLFWSKTFSNSNFAFCLRLFSNAKNTEPKNNSQVSINHETLPSFLQGEDPAVGDLIAAYYLKWPSLANISPAFGTLKILGADLSWASSLGSE